PEVAAAQRRQARAVYRLAEVDGCRHERLVGHFGERIAPCGDACDRCTDLDALAKLPAAPSGRAARRGRTGPAGAPAPGHEALFESLRAWRARTAKARGVPAFVVFADAALAGIAAARPASEEALLDVKGVGPKKLAEYGAELLEIVRDAP
ncbi:MAG TPA: HRDC domain-containing protein, partial [Anaeromyxobacter sp.]